MFFAVLSPKYFTEMRTETAPITFWWIANSLVICHIESEEKQMYRGEQHCLRGHTAPAQHQALFWGPPRGVAEKDRGGQKNPWLWKTWRYTRYLEAMLVNTMPHETTRIQCVSVLFSSSLCVPTSDDQGDTTGLDTASVKGAPRIYYHWSTANNSCGNARCLSKSLYHTLLWTGHGKSTKFGSR